MKRALVLAAGLSAILSGCNRGAPTSDKAGVEAGYAAPAADDGDVFPEGKAPDDPSGAIGFVGGIYQSYLRGERPDPSKYYSAKLKAAVGRLDHGLGYDPFCPCRKGTDFGYAIQRDDPLPDGRRRVEVDINFGENVQTRVIILTRENGAWRVDNFGEGEGALYK